METAADMNIANHRNRKKEATAKDLTAKSPLAPSSTLSSVVGLIVEMNIGKAEPRNSNFATPGAGSED